MHSVEQRASRMLSLDLFKTRKTLNPVAKITMVPPERDQKILRMQLFDGVNKSFPPELDWLGDLIDAATKHQKEVIGIKHPFIHITVRHGYVNSVTDDEWHVDGFSTKFNYLPEQNYVWCSNDGTEVNLDSIVFPDDFNSDIHNLNDFFDDQNIQVTDTLKAEHLYCIDPYVPHRRPSSTGGKWRTFVRMTFSPLEVADIANTSNPNKKLHHPKSRLKDGVFFRSKLLRYGESE